ncbi:hypothetical protein ABLE68_18690 [Nocardioides sp. CN2-186]|uniref:hypothetical protein n=1 Tax=Nocardioides tweenelious TaxID=3156607 RepID=UPI0032B4787F
MFSRVATTALTLGIAAASLVGVAPTSTAAPAAPTTKLTLQVAGCNGCHLRLTQALEGRQKVWQSKQHTVKDGKVSWTIPTTRTHGLSITVLAPWDGGAGYVPTVAFRYAGEKVGDEVTNAVAKTKKRASSCWAGTTASAVTLPLTVIRARSTNPPGDPIRTPRAFTSVTQKWEKPMNRAWHGISGTQDATWCG